MPQPAPIGKFYFTFSIAGGEIIHIRPKKKRFQRAVIGA